MNLGTGRRWWSAVALLWVVAAFLYWWSTRELIANWEFADPDDQMRLQQVRDLLAGQSWFDLTQYRMNPPLGTPMHWSRWVDLPVAGLILIARPFTASHGAELFACIGAPLLTLGVAMVLSALLARRLMGRTAGIVAAALAPFTTGTLPQMRPMRVDRHGWQMVTAMAIVVGALDRNPRRGGLVAGGAAAMWLAISLEGLPFAAATGALFGLRWLIAPYEERARFASFALALGGGEALLFVATKALPDWGMIACDAVTIVHVAMLGIAAAGALLAIRFASSASFPVRLAALAATAAAAALVYRVIAPQCAAGAFAQLDPLVYRFWYLNVPEGLPLWVQSGGAIASAIGFPIVGLLGALAAWRWSGNRRDWLTYLFLLGAAMVVTVFVQRGGAAANLVAIPGGLWLMARAFAAAQRIGMTLPRVLASAAAAFSLTPMAPALTVAAIPRPNAAKVTELPHATACSSSADYATAAALPRSTLFTGIDIGPGLIFATDHSVVASGHHRNAAGMHDVIAAFLGDPETAHRIIRRHAAAYVVTCPDLVEMAIYRRIAPRGLWAQLAAGRTPAWLKRVTLPGSKLAIWKVLG